METKLVFPSFTKRDITGQVVAVIEAGHNVHELVKLTGISTTALYQARLYGTVTDGWRCDEPLSTAKRPIDKAIDQIPKTTVGQAGRIAVAAKMARYGKDTIND